MERIEKVLRFSQSLYLRDAVTHSAAAYTGLFRAHVLEDGHDVVVHIDGEDVNDELLDNFANHVLFETVRLRQATTENR